jgi:methyl-accepting chemotaxis protein
MLSLMHIEDLMAGSDIGLDGRLAVHIISMVINQGEKMKMTQMKVAVRLSIGFGLVATLLVVMTMLGMNRMAQIEDRLNEIANVNNVESKLAATMDFTITERALALRNLILLNDDAEIQIEVKRIAAQTKKYAEAEEKLSQMFATLPGTTSEEKTLLEKIKLQAVASAPFVAKATQLGLAKKGDEAYNLLRFEFRPVQKKWWDLLRELRALEEKKSEQASIDAEKAYQNARSLMLTFGGLALLSSIAAAFLITRGLVRQLGGEPGYAAEIAGKIAAGDLSVAVINRRDDHSSLLFSMKAMRDSLASIVAQVHTSTDTIATASRQIAVGNLELSSRTEEQASSLEQTSASMEELTSTVKQNADNAHQANTLVVSASEVAVKGGEMVSQVVDTMGAINESAKKIVDIISVIDGIAFQTNILALNAAVEAARAGEQGRGFAVVASEVRNLAQRSAAAAKEIKALIVDSVEKVDIGNKLVGQAGATMDEVVSSVKRVTDIMAEIMAASAEQTSGIEQINQAIGQMDQVTQQNAALVEQAAAAAESMQEQAANLAQVVSVFRLDAVSATQDVKPSIIVAAKPVAMPQVKENLAKPPKKMRLASGSVVTSMPRKRLGPVHAVAGGEWEEF